MNGLDILFALVGLVGGFGLGWMALGARAAKSSGYGSAMREQMAKIEEEKNILNRIIEDLRRESASWRDKFITLEARRETLEQEAGKQANKIFESMSQQSEKKLGDLLNPLRERIGEFQKLVTDSFTAHGKEQHTLKSEIEKIVLQTDSLSKALRGDVKAQGNWGEVILERVLEASGLQRGRDYVTQGSEMGLTGSDGERLKPDVIINLPEGKHIVIDAKVSLTSYERFCAEPDEEAKKLHLAAFLKSIRAHVSGLESKRYQHIEKLGTPDFVLMFMPIEGAYSLAMQNDPELHRYAWERNILLVSPGVLFGNLRTIASIWRIELQNRNAQEIARQGGALYDKFAGFVEDMEIIGKQLGTVQKTYDGAMNKLSTGRGNLMGGIEKLKQLGAKTSKALPVHDADEEEDEAVLQIAQG